MKLILVFSFILISLSGYSQQNTDSITIAQLIIDDYKTLGNWNIQKHIQNCTSNYTLIEDGEILTLYDEIAYFKKNDQRKIKRTNSFRFKNIRTYDNYGYAVYTLKSDIVENGKLNQSIHHQ